MSEPAVNLNQEMENKALAIVDEAHLILVTDNDSMEKANQFNLDIRQAIKDINDWFDPMVKKAHEAHRSLTAKRSETLKPLEDASAHVTKQVKLYLAECRRKEEEEAERLREIARKEEEERRLAQAAELEQEGAIDEANALLDEPIMYVAPVPVMDVPKVDGRLYRTQIKVCVTDRIAFLNNIPPRNLAELIPESAWAGIENGLSRKAKALGKAFQMKGCEVYEV